MSKKKHNPYIIDGEQRGLSPFESTILEAFETNRQAHDGVSIAAFLDGGFLSPPSRYRRVKKIADASLIDLLNMGYVTRDAAGWYRLAIANEEGQSSTPEDRT